MALNLLLRKVFRLFGQVTIIGVGLIGGSLGLALKERGLAERIVGVSRKQATLDVALARGLIDIGFVDVADGVRDADLVVLCTPLLSYAELVKQIAPHLKDGAVLTDVGSVKGQPSVDILAQLSEQQKPFFVAGHPIAGTENSGPEAAFATLYDNKKVILTSTDCADQAAVGLVKSMWQKVGAEIELMDAQRHDAVYATVSHLVQLLSSKFVDYAATGNSWLGSYLAPPVEGGAWHEQENADWFLQFVRLAGSDSTMWRDIFAVNHAALQRSLAGYLASLNGLISQLENADWQQVSARLQAANEKRRHFYEVLKKRLPDAPALKHREVRYLDGEQAIWMGYIPRLLACALIEQVEEADYDHATGSGLHGFTQPLLYVGAADTAGMEVHRDELLRGLKGFVGQLEAVFEGDIKLMLDEAKRCYGLFVARHVGGIDAKDF